MEKTQKKETVGSILAIYTSPCTNVKDLFGTASLKKLCPASKFVFQTPLTSAA
jgi:hypothetical protein